MDLVLIGEHDLLDHLNDRRMESPEDFIIYLEEALESGELTIDEVVQLIHNFNRKPL